MNNYPSCRSSRLYAALTQSPMLTIVDQHFQHRVYQCNEGDKQIMSNSISYVTTGITLTSKVCLIAFGDVAVLRASRHCQKCGNSFHVDSTVQNFAFPTPVQNPALFNTQNPRAKNLVLQFALSNCPILRVNASNYFIRDHPSRYRESNIHESRQRTQFSHLVYPRPLIKIPQRPTLA